MNKLIYNTTDTLPWYRYSYVWFILFFPILAVAAGIITIWLAIDSDDGLVVDNYYKEGLAINRVLEHEQIANSFDLHADINLYIDTQEFVIKLHANEQFAYPDTVQVNLSYATRKGFDKQFIMERHDDGLYRAPLPVLINGKWYVQIESDNWRLVNQLYI